MGEKKSAAPEGRSDSGRGGGATLRLWRHHSEGANSKVRSAKPPHPPPKAREKNSSTDDQSFRGGPEVSRIQVNIDRGLLAHVRYRGAEKSRRPLLQGGAPMRPGKCPLGTKKNSPPVREKKVGTRKKPWFPQCLRGKNKRGVEVGSRGKTQEKKKQKATLHSGGKVHNYGGRGGATGKYLKKEFHCFEQRTLGNPEGIAASLSF